MTTETETEIDGRLWDFLSGINQSSTVGEVWDQTVRFMTGLGASHIGAYVSADHVDPLVLGTTPSWVWDQYLAEISPESDPATKHCREKITPYFGGQAFDESKPCKSIKLRDYLAALAEIDIRASAMIPMHDRINGDWGRFIFDTGLNANEFRKFFAEVGSSLHLAGLMSVERMHGLVRQENAPEARLSRREQECLLWLAKGLRNDRIAERMSVRPVTVGLHISNACRKLNARTRAQALVKAIQRGILSP